MAKRLSTLFAVILAALLQPLPSHAASAAACPPDQAGLLTLLGFAAGLLALGLTLMRGEK